MAEVLGFEPPSGLAEAPEAPAPLPFDDEPHLVGKTATHELWMANCRDPEGNIITISEARPIS